ncbi:glycosyl hydrolase family 28-related protein [Stratiformator vulcanicus]|uniref:Pectate lyase superfamily protein n=1 Tax=Stratiformator vulcanicus TaxID=2527980 RepID=A0A517R5L5_9PLAN|nr:glycosyl hydrolase family 28-related protein [Stratiformator vulcanicus]QDT39123.1 Pectate lyase superfamily protein [Stratiformator vulcanicus]
MSDLYRVVAVALILNCWTSLEVACGGEAIRGEMSDELWAKVLAKNPNVAKGDRQAWRAALHPSNPITEVPSELGNQKLAELGYVDVTAAPFAADPTGSRDSTKSLQDAINFARDHQMVCFFPAGDYVISETLSCRHSLAVREQTGDLYGPNLFPCQLVGSTKDSTRRARLILAANSSGFDKADSRKHVVYFSNVSNRAESPDSGEANTVHYNQTFRSIDIIVREGNDGAVGLRMQAAEGSTIQDTTIDLREGGHTGVWGLPGSGGSTHAVTVLGGKIGIDTRNHPEPRDRFASGSQPTVTVFDVTLVNQSEWAVWSLSRGPLIGAGWTIQTQKTGPVIRVGKPWVAFPFDNSFGLIDARIDYQVPSLKNVVFESDRSLFLQNVYARNAAGIEAQGDVEVCEGSWSRLKTCAIHKERAPHKRFKGTEPVYDNGTLVGDSLIESECVTSTPPDLNLKHAWGSDFPSFESNDVVNVKDFGAIGDGVADDAAAFEKAIAAGNTVFLPKGRYRVGRTVQLKPGTVLIGVSQTLSRIAGGDSKDYGRFGNNPDPEGNPLPIVASATGRGAVNKLGCLGIDILYPWSAHDPRVIGAYCLDWQAGPGSLIRDCAVNGKTQHYFNPELVLKIHHKNRTRKMARIDEDETDEEPLYPLKHPLVKIHNGGAVDWFNFYIHGNHPYKNESRVLLIQDTQGPVAIHHLHAQHARCDYIVEVQDSSNVDVFGIKSEHHTNFMLVEDSDHVRIVGHGGIATPEPPRSHYTFKNCDDFLLSNFGEQATFASQFQKKGSWRNPLPLYPTDSYDAMVEIRDGERIVTESRFERPILYRRGEPLR